MLTQVLHQNQTKSTTSASLSPMPYFNLWKPMVPWPNYILIDTSCFQLDSHRSFTQRCGSLRNSEGWICSMCLQLIFGCLILFFTTSKLFMLMFMDMSKFILRCRNQCLSWLWKEKIFLDLLWRSILHKWWWLARLKTKGAKSLLLQ